MKTILDLKRELGELYDEANTIIDKAESENRGLTNTENSRYNSLVSKMNALQADIKRREELEGFTGVSKPEGSSTRGVPAFHQRGTKDNAEAIAARYIRTGDVIAAQEMHAAAVEEYRASNDTSMNITTNADGAYLVPTGHHKGIIARRDEMLLAPKLGVRKIPGIGTTVNVPIDDEPDGEFATTSEQNDAHGNNFDRDAAAVNRVAMTLVKKTKKIELTDELLQDQDSALLPFLEDWVGRGFARTHNSMLVTEVLANGTAGLTLDSPTTIGSTEIPELVYTLQEEYEDGAAWLMKRGTESIIRGKTGDNFQFVPTPQGSDRGRRELWGFPAYATQYMGAAQASGKSLVFGNFNYVGMREAPGLTLLRDPYSVDGMLVLKYSFRAVYKVLQAEAIQYATHPSA